MKPVWPLIGSVLWGVGLLISLPMVVMSPMMFDAPGSEHDKSVWTFFWSVISFPILCAVAIIATWILYGVFRNSPSGFMRALPALVLLLPLVSVAVFLLTAKW